MNAPGEWREASKGEPCPICEKRDWCSLTGPESAIEAAVCMRLESDNRRPNGGWLHRLRADATPSNSGTGPVGSMAAHQNDKPKGKCYATADKALAALDRQHGQRTASWTYHNAAGEPVGLIVRWDRPDGKVIRPVVRDSSGWRICGMPEPRPLYGLPALSKADRVWIVEGEKAADAARSIGLVATTSPHGSKAAAKADWSPLAGKDCVLLPDYDVPGRAYADDVAAILANLKPAPTVRIVELRELPDSSPMPKGGDLVDWVDAHGDAAEPETMAAKLVALANAADVVRLGTSTARLASGFRPAMICMADVEPRPIHWLWPNRIAAGRITLAVGMPGAGKSFLTCDIAARVSTGSPWPDETVCERGSVIFITAEDDPNDTIRPRLDAHRADVNRVHLLSGVEHTENGKTSELMFSLADVDILEQAIQKVADCKLVVIDPIGSFLGGRTDAHRDNEVRGVLAPIAKLAGRYGPAVLLVAHRRKSVGTIADDMALGSRAFTGIARGVWHLTRDTEDRNRRLLLPGKCNLSAEQSGLAFTIAGEPAAVHWERDPVAMTADEALARENGNKAHGSVRDEAVDWLGSALADGPRPGNELKEAARGDGISLRTLERAKTNLGVLNGPDGFRGPWVWRLPDSASVRQDSPECAKENTLADCGESGELCNGHPTRAGDSGSGTTIPI